MSRRSSMLEVRRPSGYPRNVTVATPTSLAASALFLLAQLGHVLARDGAIGTAGIAVGHDAVSDLGTRFDPRGNRARGPEIDIVRVSRNDEHAPDPG